MSQDLLPPGKQSRSCLLVALEGNQAIHMQTDMYNLKHNNQILVGGTTLLNPGTTKFSPNQNTCPNNNNQTACPNNNNENTCPNNNNQNTCPIIIIIVSYITRTQMKWLSPPATHHPSPITTAREPHTYIHQLPSGCSPIQF